jgi:hypothetical protein
LLETVQVELIRFQLHHVGVVARDQDVAAKRPPQARNPNLHRLPRRRRRRCAPELVDHAVDGNLLAGVQQEERQQGALLCTLDVYRPALAPDLERSEDAELHARSIVTGP